MRPNLPIALGAGLIASVVFASATTGSTTMRMLLLALVPLPVALAGFSYNSRTAVLAASTGTLLLGLIASIKVGLLFAAAFAFPAAFLVHLALLHRDEESGVAWYPIGRIVIAAALMAGGIISTALALFGDMDKLRASIRTAIETMFKSGLAGLPGGTAPGDAELTQLTDIFINIVPGVSAAFWMASLLGCVWLAAHVALASGQLSRPWPDLAAISYPSGTPLLLAAGLAAGLLLDGVPRLAALSFAGALYAAYVMAGLAIIHHNTRGASWRGGALAALYVIIIVMNSGATLLLALLGLADTLSPLRRQPPGPHKQS